MLSSALRFMLAVLMLVGYVPVPTKVAGLGGRRAAESCCAPKACCVAHSGACSAGGACEMEHAAPGGAGPMLIASGCGMPAPRITPQSPDPTLEPRAELAAAPWAGLASLVAVGDPFFSGTIPDPSVPPPRA